jgi:plastocyanin
MKRLLLVVVVLALGLFAAGCGSKKKSSSTASDTTSTPAATTPGTSSTAAPAAGAVVDIKMQNISFNPKDVTAKVGDTVKWTNEDSVGHNVVATAGENFKSDVFGQGKSYTYKLDKKGTIKYVCTIHPGMAGTIVVS